MSQQAEHEEIKKKILTTGIRVGTEVKTKFMIPYITQANPEGLYLLDLDITLDRIQTAARFIKKFDINNMVDYCTIAIIAKRASGKSFLTREIMFQKKNIVSTIVVSRTEKLNSFSSSLTSSWYSILFRFKKGIASKNSKKSQRRSFEGAMNSYGI